MKLRDCMNHLDEICWYSMIFIEFVPDVLSTKIPPQLDWMFNKHLRMCASAIGYLWTSTTFEVCKASAERGQVGIRKNSRMQRLKKDGEEMLGFGSPGSAPMCWLPHQKNKQTTDALWKFLPVWGPPSHLNAQNSNPTGPTRALLTQHE